MTRKYKSYWYDRLSDLANWRLRNYIIDRDRERSLELNYLVKMFETELLEKLKPTFIWYLSAKYPGKSFHEFEAVQSFCNDREVPQFYKSLVWTLWARLLDAGIIQKRGKTGWYRLVADKNSEAKP